VATSKPTNTTAQSEAAEVRTVAELLDRGLVAGQYPRNFPLADVYAFDAERRRVINVQVKYRHAAYAGTVDVRSFDGVDFLVLYRANRGRSVAGRTEMQCWVVPTSEVAGPSVRFTQLPDRLLLAWHLIEEAARA
jgi:hypothetical protein